MNSHLLGEIDPLKSILLKLNQLVLERVSYLDLIERVGLGVQVQR